MPYRKSTIGPRMIDGKRFKWMGWGHTKKNARRTANNYRKLGYLVRVIPSKRSKTLTRVYDIYARRKK